MLQSGGLQIGEKITLPLSRFSPVDVERYLFIANISQFLKLEACGSISEAATGQAHNAFGTWLRHTRLQHRNCLLMLDVSENCVKCALPAIIVEWDIVAAQHHPEDSLSQT